MPIDDAVSKSLIDYKFYVANGTPLVCGVMFNRKIGKSSYDVSLYDMEWNRHDEWLASHKHVNNIVIPKPRNFNRMLELCTELCSEFPFVRLDLYECGGKLYFGEFTFTPSGLNGGSLSKEICDFIGSQIVL